MQVQRTIQYWRVASARISYRKDRSVGFDEHHPRISERCRASAALHFSRKSSSMSQTIEAREPRSLVSESDLLRVRMLAQDDKSSREGFALGAGKGCWLARMVEPFASQSSSSSSARLAKTSGSSSSGGSVDTQHIREGSKIMFPTFRAPAANELTGEPIDDPVRWVMRAGRVELPTAASKSRRT